MISTRRICCHTTRHYISGQYIPLRCLTARSEASFGPRQGGRIEAGCGFIVQQQSRHILNLSLFHDRRCYSWKSLSLSVSINELIITHYHVSTKEVFADNMNGVILVAWIFMVP